MRPQGRCAAASAGSLQFVEAPNASLTKPSNYCDVLCVSHAQMHDNKAPLVGTWNPGVQQKKSGCPLPGVQKFYARDTLDHLRI